jgi:hypothetical protein
MGNTQKTSPGAARRLKEIGIDLPAPPKPVELK